jgi:myo-inositol-1(or 4)-monophosphatase
MFYKRICIKESVVYLQMLKETLIKATLEGSKILQQYFNGSFTVSSKSNINDLVTQADKESEEAIFKVIRETFPDHYLLSEEAGDLKMDSNIKWIIDPIDGTVNFANGIPICCVSIAVEKDGKMILGAVYNPFINEFFFSERGAGATLNDKKIKVSDKSELLRSCLVTGFPYSYLDTPNGPLQVFEKLIRNNIPVRRLGSAAIDLCWVASGRFDGFYEHNLNAWDSAAGFLILEEAGGKATDFAGNYYSPYQPQLLATNGKIHDDLLLAINGKWNPETSNK